MSVTFTTPEDRLRQYEAMQHSVAIIDAFLALTQIPGVDYSDDINSVRRNVRHLEYIVSADIWDGEDMSEAHRAIEAGNVILDQHDDL